MNRLSRTAARRAERGLPLLSRYAPSVRRNGTSVPRLVHGRRCFGTTAAIGGAECLLGTRTVVDEPAARDALCTGNGRVQTVQRQQRLDSLRPLAPTKLQSGLRHVRLGIPSAPEPERRPVSVTLRSIASASPATRTLRHAARRSAFFASDRIFGSDFSRNLSGTRNSRNKKSDAMKRQRNRQGDSDDTPNATSLSSVRTDAQPLSSRTVVPHDDPGRAESSLPLGSGIPRRSHRVDNPSGHGSFERTLAKENVSTEKLGSSGEVLDMRTRYLRTYSLPDYESVKQPAFDNADSAGVVQDASSPGREEVWSAALDLKGLYDPRIHLPYAPKKWSGYEEATPLSDQLMRQIGVTGKPLTTAEYMRQCLTHPKYGYYTNPEQASRSCPLDDDDDDSETIGTADGEQTRQSAIFGRTGDFITAPEVSHIFGHCVCVWLVTQWQQLLRKASDVEIVELGPGRGTLLVDILSLATTSKLSDFGTSIRRVHLVEPSPQLRKEQEEALQKTLGNVVDFTFVGRDERSTMDPSHSHDHKQGRGQFAIEVHWHSSFAAYRRSCQAGSENTSAKDVPAMIVAQEMFDTLPVHVFEYTETGWRERLIDVVDAEESTPSDDVGTPLIPRLRQVVAPGPTQATDILLKDFPVSEAEIGTVVEICPEGIFLIEDIQKHLEENSGVALVIDYGQEGTGDTLRAFSRHKQVPLTSYPGQVDITADVDFFALKQTVNRRAEERAGDTIEEDGVERNGRAEVFAFGPVLQGEFLMRMGASDMAIKKIESDETTVEEANAITEALKFLVLPEHMGTKFKVLALAPKRDGIFAPAGME